MSARFAIILAAVAIGVASWPEQANAVLAVYKEGGLDPVTGLTYTGAEDTMVLTQGGNSTDNFGQRGDFSAGRRDFAGGGTAHGLVRFDITSLNGQYTSINSVTLRLYPDFVDVPAGVTETMELHRVTSANTGWVEGNGASFTGFGPEDVGGSTWAFRVQGSSTFTGTPWAGSSGASTPGTDFAAAILASNTFNASTPLSTAYDFVFNDVSFIPAWTAGTNEGLLLKIPNDTTFTNRRELGWWSSQWTAANLRPDLIIDYTAIPEPSALVLAALALLALFGSACRRYFASR